MRLGGQKIFLGCGKPKSLFSREFRPQSNRKGSFTTCPRLLGGRGKNIGGDHGPPLPPSLHTTQSNYLLPWSLQLQFALSLWARFCISEKALTLAHCLRLAQSSSTSASTHKTQIVTELSIPSLQGPLGPQAQF